VLLSVEASVLSVDNLEAVDQRLSRGPFTHMAPSPNGKSLALLTETGVLWVVATDFQRNLAEFDTTSVVGAEGPIRQVEWCGNDAILVTWEALVLLVGPFGDTLQCVPWRGSRRVANAQVKILLCRAYIRRHRARRC
jgi:hypothetical protein